MIFDPFWPVYKIKHKHHHAKLLASQFNNWAVIWDVTEQSRKKLQLTGKKKKIYIYLQISIISCLSSSDSAVPRPFVATTWNVVSINNWKSGKYNVQVSFSDLHSGRLSSFLKEKKNDKNVTGYCIALLNKFIYFFFIIMAQHNLGKWASALMFPETTPVAACVFRFIVKVGKA